MMCLREWIFALFCTLALCGLVIAEEIVIKGKVRDANTYREIPGVNIVVPDANVGTSSNTLGRFELTIVGPDPEMIVRFQHVSYDTLELTIEDVLSADDFHLIERVIEVPVVQVETIEDQLGVGLDVAQSISIIDARSFDLRGYVDAGDLLKTEHSIQVDEELTGKKTVAIRGGSPDEVVVLYNGIKMNNALDNIFDISVIDLTDVERFEIIKGSNTTLYGPEAFSGVINIIPRAMQDYNFRFQKRNGSYDASGWGLNLYRNFGKLHSAYGIKRGSSERKYSAEYGPREILQNQTEHHSASLVYNFKETDAGQPQSMLGVMFISSELDHFNERENETLATFNRMVSSRFIGNIPGLSRISLSGAYQWKDETQLLQYFRSMTDSGFVEREIDDQSFHFNAEKAFRVDWFDWLVGYQFKRSEFDFHNEWGSLRVRSGDSETASLLRQQHGITSVVRFKPLNGPDWLQRARFDISTRYDLVSDEEKKTVTEGSVIQLVDHAPLDNEWDRVTALASASIGDNRGNYAYQTFMKVGTNIKFPTLLHQISTTDDILYRAGDNDLQPEKNHSIDVGVEYTREVQNSIGINGWSINAAMFRNWYENKFVSFYLPGTPIALYENVESARITGMEFKQSLYLFRKRMTLGFGGSRYFFSNASSFPFKYDRKYTLDVSINQAGYALQFFTFIEGEKIARIRDLGGVYNEVNVPSQTNIDIHFSKTYELANVQLILNASGRNLLDDDFELAGLNLRDRRFYFTVGVQY